MKLYGNVTDKNNNPIADADIIILSEQFEPIFQTTSDDKGCYFLDLPSGRYPFLAAVKDYGENNLEYWCQNLDLTHDLNLDVSFDTLEIYGLHIFRVNVCLVILYLFVCCKIKKIILRKFV